MTMDDLRFLLYVAAFSAAACAVLLVVFGVSIMVQIEDIRSSLDCDDDDRDSKRPSSTFYLVAEEKGYLERLCADNPAAVRALIIQAADTIKAHEKAAA